AGRDWPSVKAQPILPSLCLAHRRCDIRKFNPWFLPNTTTSRSDPGTMHASEGSTAVSIRKPRMISDEAFLLAIRAQPDDDAPRLVFADWLEETGDTDRAEFIRLQCGGDESEREHELLQRHKAAWAGPLARLVYSYTFRRGFVEAVTMG